MDSARNREPKSPLAPVVALVLLFAVHFVVDFFGGMISPLWRPMEQHLDLPLGGALWIYVAWSVAPSFPQFFFGMLADRGYAHWPFWLAPLVLVISISCLGLASSMLSMTTLVVLGGLGLAAFHPEAAARAGALLPSHRSRVMAVFSLGGYLGQAVGPYYAGAQAERAGLLGLLPSLAWLGVLLVIMISWFLSSARQTTSAMLHGHAFRKRNHAWRKIAWLLVVGSLRVSPAMGILLGLAYVLEARGLSESMIGGVQSALMAGIGAGGFIAIAISQRWERWALCWMPIATVPWIAWAGYASGGLLVFLVLVAGVLHGVGLPVFVSYGQQLMPAGERIANSITMGVSWGVASGLVAATFAGLQWAGVQAAVFPFFAGISLLCGLICFRLPHVDVEASLSGVTE